MATNYKKCPFCGANRMLYQVIYGKKTRICFMCFKIQQQVKVDKLRADAGEEA